MNSPVGTGTERYYYAEKSVIGCVMLDERCIDVVMEILKPEDFFTQLANIIYKSMCELRERNSPINLATVLALVGNNDYFLQNDGITYLSTSSMDVGSANLIEHFCKIVRSESMHRKLLTLSDEIRAMDWSCVDDPDAEVYRIGDRLDLISEANAVTSWQSFSDVFQEAYEDLLSPEPPCVINTGFTDIDNKLQLKPGSLTIVAARPAMGKSAFGINILSHIAFDLKLPVAMFSLEMTNVEIVNRIISERGAINGSALRNKRLSDDEWSRMVDVAKMYKDASVLLDDTAGLDITTLRERARRLHRQYGITCLIVDYLQLMHADGRKISSREQEVSTISRGLKLIAKELKIPVIALSQLNRQLETRADKHPIMSDLRESGSIEQDADNILFLHREKEDGNENTADLDIAKQRNGPTGRVKLYWDGNYTRFTGYTEQF